MKNAQKLREFLATGTYDLQQIHEGTQIPKPTLNTYLHVFRLRGEVGRTGTRGRFIYHGVAKGSGEAVAPVAEENGVGGVQGASEVSA